MARGVFAGATPHRSGARARRTFSVVAHLVIAAVVTATLASTAGGVCCVCSRGPAQVSQGCYVSGTVSSGGGCPDGCAQFCESESGGGGTVLGCCESDDCGGGVANDCAASNLCVQDGTDPTGFCAGSCFGTPHTPTSTTTATGTATSTGTVTETPTSTGTTTKTGTATSTATATATGTVTQTGSTPTNTPVPQGGACTTPSQCSPPFCVDGVCCDRACTAPLEQCNLPGQAGTCASTAAEAPALTPWALIVSLLMLGGIAGVALRRRIRRE